MNTHTSTKKKLNKQIILIDIFYNNHKENLYYSCNSNTFKINSNTCKSNSNNFKVDRTPHHNKDGGVHNKDGGIIANRSYPS